MEELFVVGSGTMGSGIAHAAALQGLTVHIYDTDPAAVDRALERMETIMARQVERGKLTAEDREQVRSRIHPTSSLAEGAGAASFVVEAVVEKEDLKKEVFRELDPLLTKDAVLATNTSSISITELAKVTSHPERVVGTHFFNPAQVMKLVEVVRGAATADATVERAKRLADSMDKTAIEVKIDSPGFVVNRILMPFLAEAVKVLEEGIATKEDIDTAVRLGLNHPMGPLTLLDFTGVDVCTYVMEYFLKEFGDARYAPPQTLKRLTRAGWHGRKAGKGFYEYGL